ncbi:hypothetical protein ACFFF5_10570 [Lederbergia wuyishanensis]|uniref:FIMAH domain-containing protein n=1 Tax=Lederbergia wuyishanensis TaxID=1347903 RepID=A0ABU0D6T2_9BACI|nr:hypothetical protein [Lederbergia wuyishanensis]MCJ8008802.1 hypothetical protein [Lederbergia wuyishanensis]MDQ0344123.1 hypothetical protein [Lederbergia wuyishanensis]
MQEQLGNFIAAGDVSGPIKNQLLNSLKQAEQHYEKGHQKQAIKTMEDFIKRINNKGFKKYCS